MRNGNLSALSPERALDGYAGGDGCDLNDDLIYVATSRKDGMEWQNEQGFESWNAYKGDLGILESTGV